MNKISVIIPLYKCEDFIYELTESLLTALTELTGDYEIIMVNDGSPMDDWEMVLRLTKSNRRIKGINLSRNFGQHYAITAGLEHSTGEWIVVMDGDLQDRPEEISHLYIRAREGFDIVFARRAIRSDSIFKKLGSKLFYAVLAYLTDTEQNSEIANFGIYRRRVVQAILSMNDYTRYFPTMVKWVGFTSTIIDVEHGSRGNGKSGYTFSTLTNLAIDTILSFSDKPLRLTIKLGIIISGLSFIFALYILYQSLTHQINVSGYSSLIISIWFLSGVVMTLIGMLGLYIGRIFDQVKNRPSYIIKEMANLTTDD